MLPYPDIIWTALVIIGGFKLLEGHEDSLNRRNYCGVLLIFAGFLVQVYWRLATNPAGVDVPGIVFVTILGVAGIFVVLIRMKRRLLRKESKK